MTSGGNNFNDFPESQLTLPKLKCYTIKIVLSCCAQNGRINRAVRTTLLTVTGNLLDLMFAEFGGGGSKYVPALSATTRVSWRARTFRNVNPIYHRQRPQIPHKHSQPSLPGLAVYI